jgi:hypothetical protein
MADRKSSRPWWYGDNLPWPVLILLYPVYILVSAVLMPFVMLGILFGLHLPKDRDGRRISGGRVDEPSWMGRDPGPDSW